MKLVIVLLLIMIISTQGSLLGITGIVGSDKEVNEKHRFLYNITKHQTEASYYQPTKINITSIYLNKRKIGNMNRGRHTTSLDSLEFEDLLIG